MEFQKKIYKPLKLTFLMSEFDNVQNNFNQPPQNVGVEQDSNKESAELCKGCTKCCEYIAMELDTPETLKDFENIKWYLLHNNVRVFIIEKEDESVAQVQIPKEESIRIVCAKEGSAKFVAEILINNGWKDVQILEKGIKTWGNMLAPKLVASENGYELYQFIRPGKASCSYGLIYEDEMVVFDPSRNVQFYQDFAKEHGVVIIKTFETHLQADYISGSKQIASDTGAQIVGHQNDFKDAVFEYQGANDQDVFHFSKGGPEIKAIHTPGHTPGSTSYLIDNKCLVSGDAIFILSIGRPDLGGMAEEWSKQLFKTLKTKIADMNDDLLILPGHYHNW